MVSHSLDWSSFIIASPWGGGIFVDSLFSMFSIRLWAFVGFIVLGINEDTVIPWGYYL
jgi:hypothetical protein